MSKKSQLKNGTGANSVSKKSGFWTLLWQRGVVCVAGMLMLAGPVTEAHADPIFNNTDGPPGQNYGYTNGEGNTYRGFATYIPQVDQNTFISDFQLVLNIQDAQPLEFVIFNDSTGALLVATTPQSYTPNVPDVFSIVQSPTIDFTMIAGTTYDFGYESLGTVETGLTHNPYTMNGITSGSNPVFVTSSVAFRLPVETNTDYDLILNGPSPVPEPSTLSLTGATILAWLGCKCSRWFSGRQKSEMRQE